MLLTRISGIKVSGICAAVSNDWKSISEIAGDEADPATIAKFTKNTGVKGRYNAGRYQTSSDFCVAAAKEILQAKNIAPSEIGVLVFVTQTADYRIPATACLLQSRLGLPEDCIAFDVNLGCSGFTYGMNIVSSLMKSSNANKALLLCGDTVGKEKTTRYSTKHQHSTKWLMGDAGTATLLEKDENAGDILMLSRTDGEGYKAIIAPYGLYRNPDPPEEKLNLASQMDDVAVFTFATRKVPVMIDEAMRLKEMTPADYDCLVLHQANLLVMKQIARKTGFPMDKVLVSLDEFGNTSCASIPVSMVKRYGNESGHEIHAMCCGFGVGLSWSTTDFTVSADDILPLVHTDEYFDDGYKAITEERM